VSSSWPPVGHLVPIPNNVTGRGHLITAGEREGQLDGLLLEPGTPTVTGLLSGVRKSATVQRRAEPPHYTTFDWGVCEHPEVWERVQR
jgi:hypothetical protein